MALPFVHFSKVDLVLTRVCGFSYPRNCQRKGKLKLTWQQRQHEEPEPSNCLRHQSGSGKKEKRKIFNRNLFEKTERFFEIPKFPQYATARGIHRILFSFTCAIKPMLARRQDWGQSYCLLPLSSTTGVIWKTTMIAGVWF